MIDRLQNSVLSMQMLSKAQEITANNLANVNTPGFKADRVFFEMFMNAGNQNQGSGVLPVQFINFEQGQLEQTGNMFDLALEGNGFFLVEKDNMAHLTRNGRFNLDSSGYLIDDRGSHVQGRDGNIIIPEYLAAISGGDRQLDLEISQDGTIRLNGEIFDQIRVVSLENPENLRKLDGNYFIVKNGDMPLADDSTRVLQGYIELGNVNPMKELLDMTQNFKLFEAQQRIMRSTDDMLSGATHTLGRF